MGSDEYLEYVPEVRVISSDGYPEYVPEIRSSHVMMISSLNITVHSDANEISIMPAQGWYAHF